MGGVGGGRNRRTWVTMSGDGGGWLGDCSRAAAAGCGGLVGGGPGAEGRGGGGGIGRGGLGDGGRGVGGGGGGGLFFCWRRGLGDDAGLGGGRSLPPSASGGSGGTGLAASDGGADGGSGDGDPSTSSTWRLGADSARPSAASRSRSVVAGARNQQLRRRPLAAPPA